MSKIESHVRRAVRDVQLEFDDTVTFQVCQFYLLRRLDDEQRLGENITALDQVRGMAAASQHVAFE